MKQSPNIRFLEPVPVVGSSEQPSDLLVAYRDTFRFSGRSRRINHVCDVPAERSHPGILAWPELNGRPIDVDADHPYFGAGSRRAESLLGQEHFDRGVLNNVAQAVAWIGWVKRHICRS